MQIGEKYLARPQQRIFGLKRFLDLHDHPGFFENRAMVRNQGCAGLFVIGIWITCARARAAFDKHLMAALDELIRRRRQQRHAVFGIFDFFGYAYDHKGGRLMELARLFNKRTSGGDAAASSYRPLDFPFGFPSVTAFTGLPAIAASSSLRSTIARSVTEDAASRSASMIFSNSPKTPTRAGSSRVANPSHRSTPRIASKTSWQVICSNGRAGAYESSIPATSTTKRDASNVWMICWISRDGTASRSAISAMPAGGSAR